MKKSRLLIAAGAILVISITIIAAISHIPRERIIADPTALFNEVLLTENADNGAYSITAIETVSVGNETYICETQTIVNIYGRETDAPTLFVQKDHSIGEHTFSIFEWYQNNTLITEINGTSFSSSVSCEGIKQRYIPKIILTPDIYASVTGTETKESYEIHFSQASKPEYWLSETDIILEQATGSAFISKDKNIQYLTYFASYQKGSSHIQSNVKVEPIQATEFIPETSTKDHISLQYTNAPELLEKACGYILASKTFQAQYEDSILCEAFGDLQTQHIEINVNDTGSLTAGIKTEISLENLGKKRF